MTAVARIRNYVLRVLLEHLQAYARPDDSEVMGVDIPGLGRRSCFNHMTGGAAAGSSGLRSVVVFGVDPDSPWIGKLLMFSVAGETEGIVIVSFDELGSARSSVRIVTIKTVNASVKMAALLKVEPLLVLRFGMRSRISPGSWFKLIITG